ncbi:tRNA 2-selenouridine(34) synthase MnmH [Rhodobacter maris]|uniref:tRNA 2-selenouridine synthase n=1 Tax=Rhodobacter maris TaxID=446682 RepID=A0A285REB3_9RHOB|nr:tRNA 2-selenouridine(34) synthase MnmH [Rhodobacter maris]SOB92421.1 tRNA 2-selenouridine synthase [Rhodobacter maris]
MQLLSVGDALDHGFDTVIDVRSPAEFARDHLPGAINLPVLSDAERVMVGTIYKQVAPFEARKLGAALVARNAAAHLEGPLADKPGGWRPLIYCWRGGQRSGSFATILRQIGWRAELLEGGYKSWRRVVMSALAAPPISPVVLLDGNTGAAKTEILRAAAVQGAQVIDLEGLANHRGSIFGAMPGGQPAQTGFESRLAEALAALDPARPVLIEAESATLGALTLPGGLWQAIRAAPRLRLVVPRQERAAYLARAYADLCANPLMLARLIDRLRPYHAAELVHDWHRLAGQEDFVALAGALMAHHYDPRYERHRARASHRAVALAVPSLAPAAIAPLAAQVRRAAEAMARGEDFADFTLDAPCGIA